MTDEMIDLARRAVACKHWRWMPGMRYSTEHWRAEGFERVPERMETAAFADWLHRMLPDLTDPATIGCLLALVREAWGCSVSVDWLWHDGPRWFAQHPSHEESIGGGLTEAAALVAALEAAND